MKFNRKHTLYLKSQHRESGTSSRYVYSLPDDIVSDPNLEQFRIVLKSFSCYNNWFLIKQGSNTVSLNGVPYTVPNGTYTYQKLSRVLSSLLNISVSWMQITNQMKFTSESSKTIRFDKLGHVIGFLPNTDYVGFDIISIRPMEPYPNPTLLVHIENISPSKIYTIYSNHTGSIREVSILGKVFINSNPFHLITYQNQNFDSDGLFCAENTIGDLKILITDTNGEEILEMPEHDLVISIESFDVGQTDIEKVLETVREIHTTLEKMLMLKVYK